MKFSEVVFLELEELEEIHQEAITRYGGSLGMRDRGLFESAAACPQTTLFGQPAYPSIIRMAAALARALAKNHAFVDGNKRVAFTATRLFLGINGFPISLPFKPWKDRFEALASGMLSREDFAGLLAQQLGTDEPIEAG